MPVVTESELPLLRSARRSISTVPPPALAKLLLPLFVKPPAKVAVALTVLNVAFDVVGHQAGEDGRILSDGDRMASSLVTGPLTVVDAAGERDASIVVEPRAAGAEDAPAADLPGVVQSGWPLLSNVPPVRLIMPAFVAIRP